MGIANEGDDVQLLGWLWVVGVLFYLREYVEELMGVLLGNIYMIEGLVVSEGGGGMFMNVSLMYLIHVKGLLN